MHFLILLFLAYNCLIFPNLNIWAFVSIWCEPSTTESQQTKMHLLHLAVSLMPNMTKFSSHFSLFRGYSGTLILLSLNGHGVAYSSLVFNLYG